MAYGISKCLTYVVFFCTFYEAGESNERISGCLSRETGWTVILYSESSSVSRCTNNRMTEKYQGLFWLAAGNKFSKFLYTPMGYSLWSLLPPFSGPGSFIQASEKSFSMVKGGRVREAEALTWEREGSAPNKISYKNWAKSVLENPALVDYKVKSRDLYRPHTSVILKAWFSLPTIWFCRQVKSCTNFTCIRLQLVSSQDCYYLGNLRESIRAD